MAAEGGAAREPSNGELRRRVAELEAENAELRRLRPVAVELGTGPAEALRASEARYRLVVESATDYAIFTMDLGRRVTGWNTGAERVLGWAEAEMLGRSADAIFTPEDRQAGAPEAEARDALERGRAEDVRWHLRRDGSRFWANGVMLPLRDEAGAIGGLLKILRDRTERLDDERDQLRRLERMKALAEAARAIVGAGGLAATLQAITDAARGIVGAHQAVCSLTRGDGWAQAINAVSLSDKYARWRDYGRAPDGSGIYAWVCEGNRTVRMTQEELEAHPRWRGFGGHAGDHPPMRGWLAAALVGGDGRNLGLVQLSDKHEGEFDEADEAIVAQLAQFAASAIERAQAEDERRAAEARLRVERELLDAVIRQAPVGISISEAPSGRALVLNDKAVELLGHPQRGGDAGRYGRYGAVHPDGRPYAVDDYPTVRALRRGEVVEQEEMLYRRGGPGDAGRTRFAVSSAPVRDGAGEVAAAVTVFVGVEERRRAEAALRESEGRLRALADNLPSGMVYQVAMRRDGSGRRFAYVSGSCERLTGVSAEAALADPGALYGTIAPEDRPGLAVAEEAAIRDLAPFEVEARLVRADTGEVRWCRIASAPREAPDGSLVWDGLLVDVTGQRAAEAALREEARSLEVLNRTGALLAAELDLRRLVQAVTDAATELSGAAFGAFFYFMAGERGEALTLYALSGAPRSAFERFPLPRPTSVFGPTLRGEGVVRSADITADPRYGRNAPHRGMPEGHLPVRSYLAVPVASRSGEVLGALFFGHPEPGVFGERAERLVAGVAAQAAVAIDNSRLFQAAQREVAARGAAEAELRRLNETLEERVRERTRALEAEAAERERAEEQLRQAQKMEAVGQLTGGIAHDFNNLLTGIVGALAILQRRVDAGRTEGLERYTGAAITSAQRAAALTQRLLAFARRQPLDPKPVDANRLVAGMEDLLRRTLGPAIGLEMVLAGGLWPALCDPNQLESAILNLAINARDAMPGGGRLTVETANAHLDEAYARAQGGEVRPGQYVAVCVTDTGAGMAPEVAERAFEPFFTTKPLGQGTGLGLSMLYGFVKQSGGHVRVYSEVGRGSAFKLYLPRHRGSMEAPGPGAGPEDAPPRADPGETVLVVEDEPTVRMLILETLEELGYAAVEAADGPSGLRVLRSDTRVDLLVTDVGLPGLNGRQLADAAREARPGLRVLFITGYAHNAAVGNGVLEPGTEMLTKPFAMDALADKIRSMIDKA